MTRVEHTIISKPLGAAIDVDAWWRTLDTLGAADFLAEGVARDDTAEPDAAIDFG